MEAKEADAVERAQIENPADGGRCKEEDSVERTKITYSS